MDYKCSGKQSCKIDVNDLEKIVQPCSKDYKAYLDAKHKCVKGKDANPVSIHWNPFIWGFPKIPA